MSFTSHSILLSKWQHTCTITIVRTFWIIYLFTLSSVFHSMMLANFSCVHCASVWLVGWLVFFVCLFAFLAFQRFARRFVDYLRFVFKHFLGLQKNLRCTAKKKVIAHNTQNKNWTNKFVICREFFFVVRWLVAWFVIQVTFLTKNKWQISR